MKQIPEGFGEALIKFTTKFCHLVIIGPKKWIRYLQRLALPPSLGIDRQQTPSRCSCCFQCQIQTHPRDFRSLTSASAKTSSFLPLVFPVSPNGQFQTSLRRSKIQPAHFRSFVQHAERAALPRCARHFSARGTQKGVAECFLISPKAR